MKEADTLIDAEYQVDVVALDVNEYLRALDRTILNSRSWNLHNATRGSDLGYILRTVIQRFARRIIGIFHFKSLYLGCFAHHRLTRRLAYTAKRIPADLYIAHNLAALPAASLAAKENGAKLGFDAEDFHTEELMLSQRDLGDQIARETIECKLLQKCTHLTAASPLIARAYHEKYGVAMKPVLNVFPLSEAPAQPVSITDLAPLSLYWFSQTIGAGRGLEELLEAISMMQQPATLFIRGRLALGYETELRMVAHNLRVEQRLKLLPTAAPAEMAVLAQHYAVGLATEPGSSINNLLALSNKIFVYLLAGVPVLFSRTPAQEALAADLGEAAILVDLESPGRVAKALDSFFLEPERQKRARAAAWRLGRERYNWDIEKDKFLSSVEKALLAKPS